MVEKTLEGLLDLIHLAEEDEIQRGFSRSYRFQTGTHDYKTKKWQEALLYGKEYWDSLSDERGWR